MKNVALQYVFKAFFRHKKSPKRGLFQDAANLPCGLGDEKHFFDAFIHFPMARKTFGQHKAVAHCKTVAGAVRVYDAAAAFEDVAKLHITSAVGAEGARCGFPYPAAELAVLGTKTFQGLVSRIAADGAAGLAGLGVAEVMGFDANQGGQSRHGNWLDLKTIAASAGISKIFNGIHIESKAYRAQLALI